MLLNVLPSSRFLGGFYLSLIPGFYYLLSSDCKLIFSNKITLNFVIFSLVFIPISAQYSSYKIFDTSAKVLTPVKVEYKNIVTLYLLRRKMVIHVG